MDFITSEKTLFLIIYWKKKDKQNCMTVRVSGFAPPTKEMTMHERGQHSADQSSVPSIKAKTFPVTVTQVRAE